MENLLSKTTQHSTKEAVPFSHKGQLTETKQEKFNYCYVSNYLLNSILIYQLIDKHPTDNAFNSSLCV